MATVCAAVLCWPAGSFDADKLEGAGVYTYANGDIYRGGFKAGKKHGSGQMFFKVRPVAWHVVGWRVTASSS